MSKRNSILTLVLLALPLSAAMGQDSAGAQTGTTPPPDGSQQSGTAPVPAFGVDNQPVPVSENPPISGLDTPGLEPHSAPLSYLQPGIHVSESADSNVSDTLGTSAVHSATRVLGSLELQRLWSHYDLALDYVGGGSYYSAGGVGFKNIQQLNLDQRITWKRGQLGLRDAFSYLPEGSFGGAYGSEGGETTGSTFGGGLLGGELLGALGQIPRIMNLSVADVVESLSPKSTVTAAVGYAFVHYTGDTGVQGISFLGSQQTSVQAGYDRLLGAHNQMAIVYAHQQFDFSVTGANFQSNIAQLMWGHRISGRMDFSVGAGPQFTSLNTLQAPTTTTSIPPCENVSTGKATTVLECPASFVNLSAAVRASLRYKFPRTMLSLSYTRFNTDGSGLFAGAETDSVRFSASRPLSRVWSVSTDVGYSHNRREVSQTLVQQIDCFNATEGSAAACPGVSAKSFNYIFAGVAMHRNLGRDFHFFTSYQFNGLSFDPSFCGYSSAGVSLAPCSRISQRQVGTIGLDWTPRPIRLD